jgi:hypothetical protein
MPPSRAMTPKLAADLLTQIVHDHGRGGEQLVAGKTELKANLFNDLSSIIQKSSENHFPSHRCPENTSGRLRIAFPRSFPAVAQRKETEIFRPLPAKEGTEL